MVESSAERDATLAHLLLIWVLVGSPVANLGTRLAGALQIQAPVSAAWVGLLFGTVVVAALWVAGVRPALTAALAYFVAAHGLAFLVVVASPFVTTSGLPPSSWSGVALTGLSVAIPAALLFTPLGGRVRDVVRTRARGLARLPPE